MDILEVTKYRWKGMKAKIRVERSNDILENILFLRYWYPIQTKMMNKYRQFKTKRQYRYYKCKECGQELRVPKGKGKIEITCPKCHHSFIKKT